MPATIDLQVFRRCCSQFATGVCVASAIASDGSPHGLTVNSFTSVSLTPPLVLICVDHAANVIEYFRAASHFGISILDEAQREISNRFAERGQDRFENVAWRKGENGTPLLDGAIATMECAVRQIVTAGDHDIFVGEVISAELQGGRPLLYFNSGYQSIR